MSVTTTAPPQKSRTTAQNIGLILSFIVLGAILLLPTPETLSTGGHRMIGVLAFAMDDISCFLSSKCYHDYCAYGLIIRVLTKS